jgi:RNA polymerase sigma-70 factor, ECF subfamily
MWNHARPTATVNDLDRDRSSMERLRAGDERALEDLYDRHADLLYSLILRIVRGAAEAEEVLQETWLQAWRRAGAYDPSRGTVGAWLVTLARSRAIDRLRSEGSRRRVETESSLEPPAPAADPAAEASQRQRSERVTAALGDLDHREVLELAYYSGLSQAEIAGRLGAPLGTVKSWTRQALLKLGTLVPREELS